MAEKTRCPWCLKDAVYKKYHDEIWGVPEYDSLKLFEKLNLDGAQAGLSWYTVLVRTENYRNAFEGWNPEAIARYGEKDIQRLMQDSGIIRNRLKIAAVISNAKAYLNMREQGRDFSNFFWQFVDHKPIINRFEIAAQVPPATPLSDTVSKALKQEGFKFAGSTITYAFMQATGMVNDHLTTCFRSPIHNEKKC
jgi:DNA-3-methyladenine glycosylase I